MGSQFRENMVQSEPDAQQEKVASPAKQEMQQAGLGCLGVLVALVLFGTYHSLNTTDKGQAQAAASPPHWTYGSIHDDMRGTDQAFASVDSENQLQFNFPYQGGSTGTLKIYTLSYGSHEVRLYIDKGQFFCSEDHNEIVVVIDNKSSDSLLCKEPEDGSENYVTLNKTEFGNYTVDNFVSGLVGAKSLIIEAPFFQAGRQQLTFDVSGFHG